MIDWYTRVFEASVRRQDDRLAFLSYDDEHHRMAFVNLGAPSNGSAPKRANGVGVHHVAYTWNDLGELIHTSDCYPPPAPDSPSDQGKTRHPIFLSG
jgi:hypothetical protein